MNNVVEFPMAKKDDEFKPRRLVYQGQRHDDGKVWHLFEAITLEGSEPDSRTYSYKVKRNANNFIIGQLYDIPMNENDTARLSEAEATDTYVDKELIEQWSAQDQAARTAKTLHGTRQRLIRERREAWKEGMFHLRVQYKQMSIAERRAMRMLVIEWLEER